MSSLVTTNVNGQLNQHDHRPEASSSHDYLVRVFDQICVGKYVATAWYCVQGLLPDTPSKRSCDCLIPHPRGHVTASYCIQEVLWLPHTASKRSCDCLIQHSRGFVTTWYRIQEVLWLPGTASKKIYHWYELGIENFRLQNTWLQLQRNNEIQIALNFDRQLQWSKHCSLLGKQHI